MKARTGSLSACTTARLRLASEIDGCRRALDDVTAHLEEYGVSVGLVYKIELARQQLERIGSLVGLATGERVAIGEIGRFVAALIRDMHAQRSVRALFRSNLDLLTRKIAERTGKTGEHYITRDRVEYAEMLRSSGRGGALTGLTVFGKFVLVGHGLPPFVEGVIASLNYALSFCAIQFVHGTLATKQPAMTAATLAGALDGRDNREARLDALAELAAEVSRTQWVSIAGNVTITMLTAFAIALTAVQFVGWNAADPAKAAHLLHDLHPWRSLALLHAAIAGVYLFLSGLISGYYDNKALYHRIPQRLRRVKWLRALLGEERLARLADYVEHNLGALAGNFLFGCMLGFTPIVGELLGLPLDIRHVAFASANFAYGLVGLQFAVPPATVVVSVAGVLLVGLVNLVVSFSLALRVALRSRGIEPEQTEGLWGRVLQRFLRAPRDFFWPPAAEPAA